MTLPRILPCFVAAGVLAGIVPAMAAELPPLRQPSPGSNANDPATWQGSTDWAWYLACDQWRQNADGSWTVVGTVPGTQISDITLGGPSSNEGRILQQRCARKMK